LDNVEHRRPNPQPREAVSPWRLLASSTSRLPAFAASFAIFTNHDEIGRLQVLLRRSEWTPSSTAIPSYLWDHGQRPKLSSPRRRYLGQIASGVNGEGEVEGRWQELKPSYNWQDVVDLPLHFFILFFVAEKSSCGKYWTFGLPDSGVPVTGKTSFR
jgi:hypothetical protein